jgi:hypothetical protein
VATVHGAPWRADAGYPLLVLCAMAVHLVPARLRRFTLLAASSLAAILLLGRWSAALFAFVGLVSALLRLRLRLRYKLPIGLIAWAALPAARALAPPSVIEIPSFLVVIWAGLAYAAIFAFIERRRGLLRVDLVDEALYLLALPRLVQPFFQPISPGVLFGGEQSRPNGSLLWRGTALGLYGTALVALRHALMLIPRESPVAVRMLADFVNHYAFAAANVFIAMSMFRLLGFDMPSGFRRPFAATSFGDFFRRWNHYVRDATLTLFYFPLLGVLRTRLPRRAATIAAAYLAIFIGSFLLNDALVPVVTSPHPGAALARSFGLPKLIPMLVLWSAIILPRTGFSGRNQPERGAGRLVANARFLVLYVLWWVASERRRYFHALGW